MDLLQISLAFTPQLFKVADASYLSPSCSLPPDSSEAQELFWHLALAFAVVQMQDDSLDTHGQTHCHVH